MVVNQFRIVNNSNSKGLKFHWASGLNDNLTVNNISFSIPGGQAASNFSANFGGFRRLITIDFVLYDDGTDKSTDAASKTTLREQWDYLMETDGIIQGKDAADSQSDVTHTVTIYRNGATDTITGTVEDITLNGDPGTAGNLIRGTMNLFEGTN